MAKLVMLGEVEWCSGQVQRANDGEVDGTWAKLKTWKTHLKNVKEKLVKSEETRTRPESVKSGSGVKIRRDATSICTLRKNLRNVYGDREVVVKVSTKSRKQTVAGGE